MRLSAELVLRASKGWIGKAKVADLVTKALSKLLLKEKEKL